jgi:hypothetical protein
VRPHTGGGLTVIRDVFTEVSADAVWRRRERRGGYSRLESPIVEAAQAFGLGGEGSPDFGYEDWSRYWKDDETRPTAQSWSVLPLFAADARLLECLDRYGVRYGPTVSPREGPFFDLTNDPCLEWLTFLARGQRVDVWLFLLPHRLCSVARPHRGQLRDRSYDFFRRIGFILNILSQQQTSFLLLSPLCAAGALRDAAGLGPVLRKSEEVEIWSCGYGAPFSAPSLGGSRDAGATFWRAAARTV